MFKKLCSNMENIKKDKLKFLEIKTIMSEMRNTVHGNNSRLEDICREKDY